MRFRLEPDGGELVAVPEIVVVGGYTGRDREAVAAHILELEELGVPAPATAPAFYAVSPDLLIQADRLVTTEAETSGEAEAALVVHDGEVYVAVASDHTDRSAERYDIAVSKRACPKVVGDAVWRLDDVVGRWDEIELRSWIGEDAELAYQDGVLGALLPPHELLDAIPWRDRPASFVVLCGTLPTLRGIQPSPRFRGELHDAATGLRLSLDYAVETLDQLGLAAAPAG
jgi:hypothetical protein